MRITAIFLFAVLLTPMSAESFGSPYGEYQRTCSPRQVDRMAHAACHIVRRRSVRNRDLIGSDGGQIRSSRDVPRVNQGEGDTPRPPASASFNHAGKNPVIEFSHAREDFGAFRRRMRSKRRLSPPSEGGVRLSDPIPQDLDWSKMNFTTYEKVRLYCCMRACPPEAYYGIC